MNKKLILLTLTLLCIITVFMHADTHVSPPLMRAATVMPAVTPVAVNIAVGKTVQASSFYSPQFKPGNANDGDPSSLWGSQISQEPQWFFIDLGDIQAINGVMLHWFGKYYPLKYQLYVSNNGKNWTWLFDVNKSEAGIDGFYGEGQVRYLGIYCIKANNGAYALSELEVIQHVTVTPTPMQTNTPVPTPTPTAHGGVAGFVYNHSTNTSSQDLIPIAGATIEVDNIPQCETDEHGHYSLTGLPTGLHSLKVKADGYFDVSYEVNVVPDITTIEDVTLMQRETNQFDAGQQGDVTTDNGLGEIIFPGNTIVDVSNDPYTGPVMIDVNALTVKDPDFLDKFPTEFTGIDDKGKKVPIAAYAVVTASLQDINGKPLKLGAEATVLLDLGRYNLTGIQVWHYNTTDDQWIQDPYKTVTPAHDTWYQVEVDHFSMWALGRGLDSNVTNTAVIEGMVIDKATQMPVAYAAVTCITTDLLMGASVVSEGNSDAGGEFKVTVHYVDPGTSYKIHAERGTRVSNPPVNTTVTTNWVIIEPLELPPAPTPTPTATPTMTIVPTATPTMTVLPTATPTMTVVPTTIPTMTVLPTATPTATPVPFDNYRIVKDNINKSAQFSDVFVKDKYLFVAARYSGVKIFDISDPTNHSEIITVDTPGQAYAVYVSGNYAYVADWSRGLQIIDISDIQNAQIVKNVTYTGHTSGVYVSGNYAYMTNPIDALLWIIDISNIQNATYVKSISTSDYIKDVYVSGKYAYVADGSGGLQIIDISDPPNAAIVKNIDTYYTTDVFVSGNYAYVTGGNGLQIIDISDIQNATIVKTIDIDTAHGVFVSGNYAYVAVRSNGIQIIDISNTQNATIVQNIDIDYANNVYVSGNYVYVTNSGSGMQIIDISDIGNTTIVNKIDTSGESLRVHGSGNYAFVADYDAGLQIVDISAPQNARVVKNVNTPGMAYDICVSGNYAYVADRHSGIQIIDISDIRNATIVKNIDTPSSMAYGIYVSGNYAYVANNQYGIQIIDISDIQNAIVVKTINTPGSAQGIYASGNYVYVADGTYGLQIIDITDIQNAAIIKTITTSSSMINVYISGTYAYMANGLLGMQIVDISDPPNATIVKKVDTAGCAYDIYVSGNYAYMADSHLGLQIIDISDIQNAKIIKNIDTYQARGVYASGNNVYVADYDEGLVIIGN